MKGRSSFLMPKAAAVHWWKELERRCVALNERIEYLFSLLNSAGPISSSRNTRRALATRDANSRLSKVTQFHCCARTYVFFLGGRGPSKVHLPRESHPLLTDLVLLNLMMLDVPPLNSQRLFSSCEPKPKTPEWKCAESVIFFSFCSFLSALLLMAMRLTE